MAADQHESCVDPHALDAGIRGVAEGIDSG
jgi:hypothetical protein